MSTHRPATVWMSVDGELQTQGTSCVGALEAGASVGWGVFTTGAIVNARAVFLERHIQRLHSDAVRARLIPSDTSNLLWSASWQQALERVIEANATERGLFRLTLCARGEGRWHEPGPPRALVAVVPSALEATPLEAWISPYYIDPRRPLSGVKSTSYAAWHIMATEAQERGCGEVIYRASDGSVCEGARSNVFWRSGNQIFTPALDTGCLPGIARSLLLSWLGEASSPWRPQEICASLETMLQADEIFFSNCTLGPRSVLALRGEGSAAPWTSQGESPCCTWLQKCWRQETEHAATR